jgi:hypothetical protein
LLRKAILATTSTRHIGISERVWSHNSSAADRTVLVDISFGQKTLVVLLEVMEILELFISLGFLHFILGDLGIILFCLLLKFFELIILIFHIFLSLFWFRPIFFKAMESSGSVIFTDLLRGGYCVDDVYITHDRTQLLDLGSFCLAS